MPNLDLLRSMAVLSVVAEHILLALKVQTLGRFPVPWIGVVGVYVFFIHTALVLMWSLERRPFVLDFYIRRVFRIYPLAILAVLAAWAFHAPVAGSPTDFFQYSHLSFKEMVANFTLTQNLFKARPIESVLWSLPFEVQMYVLLPALFFFVQRNFVQWTLVLFFALSVGLCWHTAPLLSVVSFAPYFLSGVIAYVGFARRRATLPAWLLPVTLVAAGAVFLLDPGFRPAWYFCLFLGTALPSFRQIHAAWLKRSSLLVARYSYGIYLAHPFALVLGIYFLPHAHVALQVSVVIGATAVLAIAAYHLLEQPMIRLGSRVATKAEKRYEQRELAHYRAAPTI